MGDPTAVFMVPCLNKKCKGMVEVRAYREDNADGSFNLLWPGVWGGHCNKCKARVDVARGPDVNIGFNLEVSKKYN